MQGVHVFSVLAREDLCIFVSQPVSVVDFIQEYTRPFAVSGDEENIHTHTQKTCFSSAPSRLLLEKRWPAHEIAPCAENASGSLGGMRRCLFHESLTTSSSE